MTTPLYWLVLIRLKAVKSNTQPEQFNPELKSDLVLKSSRHSSFTRSRQSIAKVLKFSSSICAVAGGVIVSSNIPESKYGFILLALSSSQIFMSSSIEGEKSLMIYSASLFIFVDCLGIYRWLIQVR
ncbi:hypothetical protein [Acaryochloris sp. IP29b_bin.148]|uniref:hypothetical protein n=1 Tax=Acaryochloris sp. IP29b_bin.148 TaxID=2969218 RepID=UPI002627BCE6|nr:hypothetical protein [Acaryochloris sp. IP29b_bin.148]